MSRLFKLLLLVFIGIGAYSCHDDKPVLIPIGDFFKTPEKNFFKISPDGKFVSYLKPYKDKQNLVIRNLKDGTEHFATTFTDYSIRPDYRWTFNNKIVFCQDIIALDQFKVFALDLSTGKVKNIVSEGKVRVRILNLSRQWPDVITIAMNKRDLAVFDVYRLNVSTGALTEYIQNPGNFTDWYADDDGTIRLVKASDGVNESILFRSGNSVPFKTIIVNNFKTKVEPVGFTADPNCFYALSNVNRDKTALVEINALTGKEEKVIYANDKADLQQVDYSRHERKINFASWEEDRPKKQLIDKDFRDVYAKLSSTITDNEIKIVDRDSAEDKFIVNTYTDRNPGSFYLYERSSNKLTKLGDVNTKIHPSELCPMQPISYKASDGVTINGYLTLPKGNNKNNLPVVVMPHDWLRANMGRTLWAYNPEVQFLANRGYAVFQVNYRGSEGYGKEFHSAGFKQVGGKVQQDITDGVNWLMKNKTADPKRIAIFGGGFGGFSALYGVSFHQNLYNCAIVQYGLINFFTYIKDAPPYLKPYLQMMYEIIGNPETDADRLRNISPVFHTDKIKVPLLIFQGAKDPRANLSELNQFVIELHKRNVPVYYFLKDNERAVFRSEHNRMQMYAEIEKFLNNNMRVKQ